MKAATQRILKVIVIVALLTSCAQNRTYSPKDNAENSAKLSGYTFSELIQELNEQMDCDMWEISEHGATLRWASEEEMGDLAGYWKKTSGEIKINESLADSVPIKVQLVLLHELGHALGYDHVDEKYHVMSGTVGSNFPSRTYQIQITEFLQQIQQDQPCLADMR